uniref:Uncharacterized protein n=1 Tax=Candidatus Methanomethylicus mesodigestus TaxID=1867258 RepID=A0A7C3J1I8_9CREN
MEIKAEIKGLKYTPLMCRELDEVSLSQLEDALAHKANFILNMGELNRIAVSWWVSAKRTRSYPYARVYDTLGFSGKRATIIPVVKDEGAGGDRDFLQWDTISLMSLLGVYVIIAYYVDAERNPHFPDKITNQRFDISFIISELNELLSYQSDALHWNLSRVEKIKEITRRAIDSYELISERIGVKMHSRGSAYSRILRLSNGRETFVHYSRHLAMNAQKRESVTSHAMELTDGTKEILTIKNYLGGVYYFTSDEVHIKGNEVQLVECKHSGQKTMPSEEDIKDGLVKMILFCNLENVTIDGRPYLAVPVLKLSSTSSKSVLNGKQKERLSVLEKEAKANGFRIKFNDIFLI